MTQNPNTLVAGEHKAARCRRCNRRYRGKGEWNCVASRGVIVGYLCPRCQTPEENAEAEINFATTDYYAGDFGRIFGRPKGVDQEPTNTTEKG
ncbi:hypothetical protein [Rhodococcus globerulus]|uniref:hypothetical protein n=1 Tax=Rhodococcus globerulus TaxID=33008 RepID=UPI00301AF44C